MIPGDPFRGNEQAILQGPTFAPDGDEIALGEPLRLTLALDPGNRFLKRPGHIRTVLSHCALQLLRQRGNKRKPWHVFVVLQTIGLAFGRRDTAEDNVQVRSGNLVEPQKAIFPASFLPQVRQECINQQFAFGQFDRSVSDNDSFGPGIDAQLMRRVEKVEIVRSLLDKVAVAAPTPR
jgi:hypothetical protein